MALLFGFGILLVFSSVFVPKRVRQVGLAGDLDEIDYSPDAERRRRLAILGEKSLIGRAFGPLIMGWADQAMGLLNRAEADKKKLMMAGWPKPWHTVEDFYASKVLTAGILGVVGIAVGLIAAPEAVFVLVPVLALVGFFIPDLSLNSQAKKRREMIIAEMASVPDRIAIQVQSGKTLPLAIRAAGAIVHYIRETQKTVAGQLMRLSTYATDDFMALDAQTQRNLEIFQSSRTGAVAGSLLSVIDLTRTAGGGRLLKRWLGQPLLDLKELNRRQDAIDWFSDCTLARTRVIAMLGEVADLERLTNRIRGGIAIPRELVSLRRSLEVLPEISEVLAEAGGKQIGWLFLF